MNADFQAGRRGLEYAADKGLAVVIIEPLLGGRLDKEPPAPVAKAWETAPQKRTPAEWALLWVWNQPEVSVALSGMSTMEQVRENLATVDISAPNKLTPDEMSAIERVREAYNNLISIPCTSCRYCMPYPNNVEIPRVFQMYNEAIMYDDLKGGRARYNNPDVLKEEQRANQCLECNECLEACPQEIPIPEWLKKAHALLNQKQ